MKKTALLQPLLAAVALGAVFLSLPARAEDREWVPYKKLVESLYLDKFYAVEPKQRDHLRLLVRLEPVNKAIVSSDIVLTVAHAGGKDKLGNVVDGILEFAPNPAWIKEDAMIYTSLPKGEKVRVDALFAARTPENLQTSYADLMTSVPQWNAVIKEKAGMLRFMLPKFNGVAIHFAKPAGQTVQVLAKEGAKTYTADAKGDLKIKLDDALMQGNPQVVLSERPRMVEVDEL
jgi:hypothetical protein